EPSSPRFIVAIDFGTTYSTVAYVKVEPGRDISDLGCNDIRCIDNYPNAAGEFDPRLNARYENVPTELLYFSSLHSDSDASESDSAPIENGFERDLESPTGSLPTRLERRGCKRPRRTRKQTWTRQGHQELRDQVSRLQDRKAVRCRDTILTDYLVRLLDHAKTILDENEGLTNDTQIEYVLCVPVSWSQVASQTMHNVMAKAVRTSGLGTLLGDAIIADLFIVSEPEAAAQFVLASLGEKGRLRQNQTFILLDAGGGTVDITTYKVTSDGNGPLRLQGEMIPAGGAFCGSSLINEAYKRRLLERLDETDFKGGANEMHSVIAGLVADFESSIKRHIDFTKEKTLLRRVYLRDLRKNPERNISKGCLKFSEQENRDMFKDCLDGVSRLLESQLDRAAQKGLAVIDVVVVGGFGESPALRARIKEVVAHRANMVGGKIGLIWPTQFPMSTVARGAVLRSLNKENGPSRISRASYGFLRAEPYKEFPEHVKAGLVPSVDKVDGFEYVKDTILWVIQKDDKLDTRFVSDPIISSHTFGKKEPKFVCVECLYASPKRHSSHFPYNHAENAGATRLGRIEIDMTEFRKQLPTKGNAYAETAARMAKRTSIDVTFDLVIIVEGHQLMYEVRWPSRSQAHL
ncbi:hypothetical protein EV356DRAFT_423252, partial [Viridothelium virens]